MKSYLWVLAAALLLIPTKGAAQTATAPPAEPPAGLSWAFFQTTKNQPANNHNGGMEHLPGSTKAYTQAQINNLQAPPDWFPNEHPKMPKVVAEGAGPMVPACASCHLTSGLGHPESADLAGLSVTYLERQMGDFKSGARIDPARMTGIGKAISTDDANAASMYFASLMAKPWIKVVEADSAPKFYINEEHMRLPLPGGATEPLGERILEFPQDPSLATKRDPNSGFIAYVPKGSIAKGKDLVTTGSSGKTIQCNICHGPDLNGLNDVPRLSGVSPSYLARQLYYFKIGARNGFSAALMKPVVQHLTDEDILNISAYLASLKP